MFKLEKIFQKDDNFYINSSIFLKSFLVFLTIYIFSILEFNSIYDLFNFDIYKQSKYFVISIYFSIFYFLFSFILRTTKKRYVVHILSFLLNDIIPFIIAIPFTLYIFFILKINYKMDISNIYLLVFVIFNLFLIRKFLDIYYNNLMNNNLIQRNVMLVGTVESIQEILKSRDDNINIYKCCLINNDDSKTLDIARRSLKIPVFTDKSEVEMRILLEYHELGQIWILDDGEKDLVNYHIDLVNHFSVDIIIVSLKSDLKISSKLLYDNLINNKYTYTNYQTSQFYGSNLLIKLFLDKILSIIFLIILSPIILLVMIFIYFEDGFPLFFSQESAGWDGRRFKVYKLRVYKKKILNKQFQVIENEKKMLKIGKIIRKFRIEEIPQFINILKGEMSIVGPRPQYVRDDITYSYVYKQFLKRNKTFPGLTGWAQIKGYRGKRPSNENMKKRMEHDVWYMSNWSNRLDFYIILKTFFLIFTKQKR
jgi:lipopolysaccharide/colanic/teichoic acid biosynthesis glycosyltransferase